MEVSIDVKTICFRWLVFPSQNRTSRVLLFTPRRARRAMISRKARPCDSMKIQEPSGHFILHHVDAVEVDMAGFAEVKERALDGLHDMMEVSPAGVGFFSIECFADILKTVTCLKCY
jgi:hypothetical protein